MEIVPRHSVLYFPTSFVLLLLSFRFLRKLASKPKLPPGPSKLPIIGSLHHLKSSSPLHHVMRDLARSYGPIMLIRTGQTNLVVISSREAAKQVMQTQDANFAHRPTAFASDVLTYGSKDVAFSNNPNWHQMRRIFISEVLTSQRVKSFLSVRQAEINLLLKSLSLISDKPVNLSAMAYEFSNNILSHTAFGEKCKKRVDFLKIMGEIIDVLASSHLSDLFPLLGWLDVKMRRRVARIHREMDLLLEDILEEHLKNHREQKKTGDKDIECSFIDVLINAKERGYFEVPITADHIKAGILDVFLGGLVPFSTTITWAMTELIKHPETMRKAQAEIREVTSNNINYSSSYIQLVIKETLRLHPPTPFLVPRQCKETCQVFGYTIPSGTRVVINSWALGRNPMYWNDPEEFKPERFETTSLDFMGENFEFVPFGAGRRICAGIEFTMALLEEALASLLLHFDWKLPDGMRPEDVDMTETAGAAASKKEPLYLIPTLRVPLPDV